MSSPHSFHDVHAGSTRFHAHARTSAVIALLTTALFAVAPTVVRAQQTTATQGSAPTQRGARALTLEDALILATGSSEAVGLARAAETRARGQFFQARSALLPQVNSALNYQKQLQNQFQAITERFASGGSGGNTGGTGGDEGGGDSFADSPISRIFASPYTTIFSVQASQPIFTGGRARASLAAARSGRTIAELGITGASAQLTLDVTQAYYDAVLSDRLVAIADSSLVQSERTVTQVQLAYDVGNTSEFELIRAKVTRDNQRPRFLQARTQRELAHLRLKQLLELPTDVDVALTSSIEEAPITPVDADTITAYRLPVKQAALSVDVATQQLKASKGQRWPQLAVTTNYQRFAYPDDGIPNSLADFFPNWTVGVGLSLPLFTGGRVTGDIIAAQAAADEAGWRLRLTKEAAALDARQSLLRLEEVEANWTASVGTAEQAQRAYAIAEVRYKEGLSTQLELAEVRVQLAQALANRAQAARDRQVARIRLALLPNLPLAGTAAVVPNSANAVAAPRTPSPAGTTGAPFQAGATAGSVIP
jgi:outer membrane protein TolC